MRCAVFVSNADNGDVSVFDLDAARGTLVPVQRVEIGDARRVEWPP